MGMHLNSANVMRVIGGNAESFERAMVDSALGRIKLFSFVIHDADSDRGFDERMTDIFDDLDYLTGPDFLFFSLVNPSPRWLERARNRRKEFYEDVNHPSNAIYTADKGITTKLLADYFNVPLENLPCLVVTNSLNAPREAEAIWFVVRTDQIRIREQLLALAAFAGRTEPGNITVQSIQRCLSIVEDELNVVRDDGKRRFANGLSELLSVIYAGDRQRSTAALHSMITRMQEMKMHRPDEQLIERLSEQIASVLALVRGNVQQQEHGNFYQRLERVSQIAYRTFQRIRPIADEQEGQAIDYTPWIMPLIKIFETEINCSVGNLMRKYLKIRMPEFYNRYDPNTGIGNAIIIPDVPNPHPIDLNKRATRTKDLWAPPGLGESRLCYIKMKKEAQMAEDIVGLDQVWERVCRIRNPIFHTEPSVIKIMLDMEEIFKTQIVALLPYLFRIKENMQMHSK